MIDIQIVADDDAYLLNPGFNCINRIDFSTLKDINEDKIKETIRNVYLIPSVNRLVSMLSDQLYDLYKRGEILEKECEFVLNLKTTVRIL